MRTLQQSMSMILDELESGDMAGSRTGSKRNMELNCFLIFASCSYVISEVKYISGVRQRVFVRRRCVRCLKTIEKIRRQKCMGVRSMMGTCQVRRRRED